MTSAPANLRGALLGHQGPEGYWWYTLEANETISSGLIQLLRFLGIPDERTNAQVARHILANQRADGSWGLYFGAPPDLSTTVEAYFALKLAGTRHDDPRMRAARGVILSLGGLTEARVFTRIHLALFGLCPWEACPTMPPQLIMAPRWFPLNPYEFSSWARASIIPLLVVLARRPQGATPIPTNFLDELMGAKNNGCWPTARTRDPWSRFFLIVDRLLKNKKLPFEERAIQGCESWIRAHAAKTEDIWPAMCYAILALRSQGYGQDDRSLKKALAGLRRFQHAYVGDDIPAIPTTCHSDGSAVKLHQQCCISPVWDTPWAGLALLESGHSPDHPDLLKAARWLISKQITGAKGDWAIKKPDLEAGGWSFEFENDYFPDVDDTIQVLIFLNEVRLSESEKRPAVERGLHWLLGMQSSNGGWAAFDVDNTQPLVNKIPFSDHGACLDEPCADITGRMLELWGRMRLDPQLLPIQKALRFIKGRQHRDGPWEGRWGVNYIYGTWAVLEGLRAIGIPMNQPFVQKAVRWLKSVQRGDGGFGESPQGYVEKRYVGWPRSVPSQTAWGAMALIAAGEANSPEAKAALKWLVDHQRSDGTWEEREHTGTGFPGHFYIRYHGYRHYFPVLALARAQVIHGIRH